MTYDEILKDKDIYTRCKSAVFALFYGGEGYTLADRLGVPIQVADAATMKFRQKYPGVGRAQLRIANMFCTLKQDPDSHRITYSEPADFCESLFGFRRYFTLENEISKALFDLAQKPPTTWRKVQVKVQKQAQGGANGLGRNAIVALRGGLRGPELLEAGGRQPRDPKLGRHDHEMRPAEGVGLPAWRGRRVGGDPDQRPRRNHVPDRARIS